MDPLTLAVMAINSPAAQMWFDLIVNAGGFILMFNGREMMIHHPNYT